MSQRLKLLLLGSTLTLAVIVLSLYLPNRTSSVLLGGMGGLLTGWMVSQNQEQQMRQRLQQSEQALTQARVEMDEQLAGLHSQITKLTTELEQLRNRHHWRDFSLAPLSFKSHSKKGPKPPEIVPQAAIDWLAALGVKVESYWKPKGTVDRAFDRLALFLGDYYSILACLYSEIRRSIHSKTQVRFSLKGRCPEEIARCTQLIGGLKELSLAYDYRYSKERKLLQVGVHERDDTRRFFDGEWFERYVCLKLNQFFQAQGWEYESLRNLRIQFANGNRAELDLFWLVQGQPLWIECKTGREYDSYLKRYSEHRRKLGLAVERSILIILDISREEVEERSQLWDLTIGTRETLIELVSETLGYPLSKEAESNFAIDPLESESIDLTSGKPASRETLPNASV